jgi:hypothetical protein
LPARRRLRRRRRDVTGIADERQPCPGGDTEFGAARDCAADTERRRVRTALQFTPPNISHVTVTATIVGGTGRIAGATGTLTIEHTSAIDFQTGTSTGSGTIGGRISLAR